ncbi:MAG TPA: DNA polymerase III subunit alpha, partial [Flavisolibacter sp.]|nr:DNA polymerase III subunit alpha [Flavisolibacter sp.]
GDDYVRFGSYLELGQTILLVGAYRQRPYRDEYEFKISSINLAENIKRQLTKQLSLELDVRNVQKEFIDFLDENLKKHPGSASLKIVINEPKESLKAGFMTFGTGLEMNDDLIQYLNNKPEIDVQVTAV